MTKKIMKLEDYKEKLRQLDKNHSIARQKVHIAYADANNPYKVGDVIEDHYRIIKIDKINYTMDGKECCCKYRGRRLKKDLTYFKSGEYSDMHQPNVEKKHSFNLK